MPSACTNIRAQFKCIQHMAIGDYSRRRNLCDVDRLDVDELLDAVLGHFASVTGVLDAAERQARIFPHRLVHVGEPLSISSDAMYSPRITSLVKTQLPSPYTESLATAIA